MSPRFFLLLYLFILNRYLLKISNLRKILIIRTDPKNDPQLQDQEFRKVLQVPAMTVQQVKSFHYADVYKIDPKGDLRKRPRDPFAKLTYPAAAQQFKQADRSQERKNAFVAFGHDKIVLPRKSPELEPAERREKLGKTLGIGSGNAKAFLKKLNGFGITREELNKSVNSD